MVKCPLEGKALDYFDDFHNLTTHCREEGCPYFLKDTDEFPSGCLLEVAAMLHKHRETGTIR
jgi:hypothetical protein